MLLEIGLLKRKKNQNYPSSYFYNKRCNMLSLMAIFVIIIIIIIIIIIMIFFNDNIK